MPINASYEYINAEKEYLNAKTLNDRIRRLEDMIRVAPRHKGSENLLSELKRRLKKFREQEGKAKKKGGGKKGIRKEGFQFVLVGKSNSGKSSLLGKLTNAFSLITNYSFSTKEPVLGTFNFQGVKAQVVDMPSIGSEYFDIGLINTGDCLLVVIEKFEDIKEIGEFLHGAYGKKFYVFNKSDKYDDFEKRKIISRIKSEKINGIFVSAETGEGIEEFKRKMFDEMDIIRVYTKEPGKQASKDPVVLKKGATIKEVAESILKGFSLRVKGSKVTGPSAKFPNQKVGLTHVLRDLDIVEFNTR